MNHDEKKEKKKLNLRAGLRGAMAFALALNLPLASGTLILTTTLVICVLTVIIFGGLTGKMLQLLDIDMHLDPRMVMTLLMRRPSTVDLFLLN